MTAQASPCGHGGAPLGAQALVVPTTTASHLATGVETSREALQRSQSEMGRGREDPPETVRPGQVEEKRH